MSISDLDRIIREWKKAPGCKGIGITGGEPFVKPHLLRRSVETALELGLDIRVITSAVWASTPEEALSALYPLIGLSELFISVDRHHQKKIPPDNVLNAIYAAESLNIQTRLMVTIGKDGIAAELQPIAQILEGRVSPKDVYCSNLLTLGRASSLESIDMEDNVLIACGGLGVPLVTAKTELFLCCSPLASNAFPNLIYRGSVAGERLLSALEEDEEDYWLIQTLRAAGPDFIADRVGFSRPQEWPFMSVCDRCLHFWNNYENYRMAREAARDPSFRDQISQLLYRRGEDTPLIRHLTNMICED